MVTIRLNLKWLLLVVVTIQIFMASRVNCSQRMTCYHTVCEFEFLVREGRSMMFEDTTASYGVELQEDGKLKLKTNNFHREVPNITVPAEKVHTADGYPRNIILINDQFPGPTLEVMEGAEVAVNVVNKLDKEGLTIHWHGMHMKHNTWMDGVPYVTQCPAQPLESFMYRFIADPPGTHWYHSHHKMQRADGLFGAIIVHRNKTPRLPFFSLIVNDWFPVPSTELEVLSPFRILGRGTGFHLNDAPNRDRAFDGTELSPIIFWSALINGRGRHGNNSALLSEFVVHAGEKYRLHIVQASGEYPCRLSIDQHDLTVVESDGHRVKPITVESLLVFSGETYVVEFNTDQSSRLYWVRCEIPKAFKNHLGGTDRATLGTKAVLRYTGVDTAADPTTRRRDCTPKKPCKVLNCPWPQYRRDWYQNTECISVANLRLDPEYYDMDELKTGEEDEVVEHFLNFAFPIGSSINYHRMALPHAPLFQSPSTWEITPCSRNCYQKGCVCTNVINLPPNRTIQMVLMSNSDVKTDSTTATHHPVHLHGFSFQVLKMGYPVVNNVTGRIIEASRDIACNNPAACSRPYWVLGKATNLNFDHPPLKDTVIIPAEGYVVVRFRTTNPGYWLLHCHTMLHLMEGMALVFNVSYENHPPAPVGFPTCHSFNIKHKEFQEMLAQNKKCQNGNCKFRHTKNPTKEVNNTQADRRGISWAYLLITAVVCTLAGVLLQTVLLCVLFKLYKKYYFRGHLCKNNSADYGHVMVKSIKSSE